jgi:hypothetical protein
VPRGVLEVVEYVPRQDLPDAISPGRLYESQDLCSRLRLEHRTLTSCLAAFAAAALHLLIIGPAFLADGSSVRDSQKQHYQGNAADLQWIVLEDSPSKSAARRSSLPPPTLMAVSVTDAAPTLPSSISPPRPSASGQTDDLSGLGTMYGRYLGQIHARIDRAWRRPRSAIGAPLFQCQVQLDQDSLGRVEQVTLLECNGDTSWQVSLVHAIEAASPLPAPPTPAVFAHHVLIAFRATAYTSGADAELYEPPTIVPASIERDSLSQKAFQALREAAQARKPRVLELQIEGSKVDVEPDRQ